MNYQERIMLQENKTRSKFIQQFGDNFEYISGTPDDCSVDLSGLTQNYLNTIFIELKEREYTVSFLSGATICEETKVLFFKKLSVDYLNCKLVYFNYFKDGYISFDISGRIKKQAKELNEFYSISAKKCTYCGEEMKNKTVIYLAFDPIKYKDKIHIN